MRFFLGVLFFLNVLTFQAKAQNYRIHKVEDEDTVYSLSVEYNTTEEAIYELNPEARTSIQIGQILRIPPAKIGDTDEKPNRFISYTVRPRETVFGISQKHGIDMADLKKYNSYLYNEELGRGDVIRIPVYTEGEPQPINYNSSIQNSTFGNLKHVVLPEETRFSISQKYGISLQRLKELNPNMGVIINPGDVLTVSRESDKPKEKNYFIYVVKPYNEGSQETVYSLTKKYDVSKTQLFALNPLLRTEGLEAGMEIKIPIKKEGDAQHSFFSKRVVNLEGQLNNFRTKELVMMLPFKLNDYKTDTLSRRQQLKSNRLSQISLDFYAGVRMALHEAKAHGISVNLRVYDTEASAYHVQEIIEKNYFGYVDAVIGPLLGDVVETAAGMLNRKGIPVFSPLTKRDMMPYENLVQTRPSDLYMEDLMITYIDSIHTVENIVIIADPDKPRIVEKLKMKFPIAKVFTPVLDKEDDYLKKEEVAEYLVPDKKNWVIIESDDVMLLNITTSYLHLLQSEYDIQLFTTNRNDAYENDEVSNDNLSSLMFTFPSFTRGFGSKKNIEFENKYVDKYGIKPNKFVTRGYDLTYDILLRLTASKKLEESLIAPWTTEYVENKFHYKKKEDGSYINNAVYILQFGKDLTVKPIQL